jgi:hydroxycarboxylate dehydrogenase B
LLAGLLSGIGSIVDQPITNGICNNMLTICLDPARFEGGGEMNLGIDRLLQHVQSATAINPDEPVLFPGLHESNARATADRNGLALAPDTVVAMNAAAKRIGLDRGLIASASDKPTS